jgi:hypothetical protein
MRFAHYDQDLLAVMALSGVLLLVRGHHPRADIDAIKSALVWDLTEAGRLQGEMAARQTRGLIALESAVFRKFKK